MKKDTALDVTVENTINVTYEVLPREAEAVQQDAAYVADATYEIATIALPTWQQPVDEALKLNAYISMARSALRQTKHSAAEAAVVTYIVYRNTLSTNGAEWLKKALQNCDPARKSAEITT